MAPRENPPQKSAHAAPKVLSIRGIVTVVCVSILLTIILGIATWYIMKVCRKKRHEASTPAIPLRATVPTTNDRRRKRGRQHSSRPKKTLSAIQEADEPLSSPTNRPNQQFAAQATPRVNGDATPPGPGNSHSPRIYSTLSSAHDPFYTPSNYRVAGAPDSVAHFTQRLPPSLPQDYSAATLDSNGVYPDLRREELPEWAYMSEEEAATIGVAHGSPRKDRLPA